jgi:hypothetical protein
MMRSVVQFFQHVDQQSGSDKKARKAGFKNSIYDALHTLVNA